MVQVPQERTIRPSRTFSHPDFPADPTYPHPESKTYPQFAVHNLDAMPLVFFFLCITQNRLYIMAVVGSRNGKTLGTGDFDGGGGGRSLL